MKDITRDEIIEAARRAAAESDDPLSRSDFIRRTGISEWQINRFFPKGRWTEVKNLAGIERHPMDKQSRSDQELLSEFHKVVLEIGDIPTWSIFASKAGVSADSIRRRFGGLQGTLKAYREWLELNNPDSPILVVLQAKSHHEIPTPPDFTQKIHPNEYRKWNKVAGPQYGPPIDFRGLRHSPINEQGVVYLFGMVSYELGFIVEALQSAYPDCEAKRSIGKDRWQRVRIEFEFLSSNFRDHGHDPAGADLIVCWEHDWQDCPIEVLELRSAIDALGG